MRKISIAVVLSLVLVFGLAMQASAFNVINISGDPYFITDVSGHNVKEDYKALSLIPFPSHDGFAVVNLPGPLSGLIRRSFSTLTTPVITIFKSPGTLPTPPPIPGLTTTLS